MVMAFGIGRRFSFGHHTLGNKLYLTYDIYPNGRQMSYNRRYINWRSLLLSTLKTLETLKEIKP